MKLLIPAAILLTAMAPAAVLAAPAAPAPLAALNKAKTVQVTETVSALQPGAATLSPVAVMTIKVERPGKIHLEQKAKATDPSPSLMMVSDGTDSYEYMASRKQYRKSDAAAGLSESLIGFKEFAQSTPKPATLDGKPTLVYTTTMTGPSKIAQKLWVDAKTHLPIRQSMTMTQNGKAQEVERIAFSGWQLNQPIPAAQFAWAAPAGATEYVEPKLLAEGTEAPDFTVNDRDGKPVKLSDYRGKVVVLDFWATWCGPCQASLPHTNEVAQAFKDKGVVVLAVNVWDTKEKFDAWLPQHTQFSAIDFLIDPTKEQGKDIATTLYKVTGIPTQYVIGKDGKIVKSFVGFGGPTDDLANALKAAGAS